jgi:hypothetical protein
MTAAERIAATDDLEARALCAAAAEALATLIEVINEETTLLTAGRVRDAAALSGRKVQLAQDYVGWARAMERQADRLRTEAPDALDGLRQLNESFATQLADNLRVIATARQVTEDLLGDVAAAVGAGTRARTYGQTGTIGPRSTGAASGIALDRAL